MGVRVWRVAPTTTTTILYLPALVIQKTISDGKQQFALPGSVDDNHSVSRSSASNLGGDHNNSPM